MIDANKMIQKLGKKKFVETVTRAQRGPTGADLEKKRRWGKGRTSFQICEHGKVTIRDYKPTDECDTCATTTPFSSGKHFEPNFNIGLGCWVESRSEEKRIAKSLGLREAG